MLAATTAMLDVFGWRWWHVPAPMVADRTRGWRSYQKGAGLPDIIAFHEDPTRMVILELKGDRGRLSEEQQKFLRLAQDLANAIRHDYHDLVCMGADSPRPQDRIGVYVVTPDNLDVLEGMLRTKVLT